MTSTETIRDAILRLRQRVVEIDGLIERMERERTSMHAVARTNRRGRGSSTGKQRGQKAS
jgi:hypothetical protein